MIHLILVCMLRKVLDAIPQTRCCLSFKYNLTDEILRLAVHSSMSHITHNNTHI